MTKAEYYGLKENPFEPTGAATGKYKFVAPANFDIVEEKIEQAGIEKKLYAILVSSPHGAGKTTTMEYLKGKAINGGYLSYRAPVILTKLSSLKLEDFVTDILDEASKYGNIKKLGADKFALTPSRLRKSLVEAISPIASKHKLMLWIIDEFDILADRPKEEQDDFLQFIRDVIDEFAKDDIPIAFIMSHTKYSTKKFEEYLEDVHGPLRSRIVASLTLSYTFDEVRQIVISRLKRARVRETEKSDIHPFSEESLQTLFNLVTSVRGTENLDNFRIFERICHFALIEGADKKQKEIGSDLIKDLFKIYAKELEFTRDTSTISIEATQALNLLKSKTLVERIEAVLRGIRRGISESQTLTHTLKVIRDYTHYVGKIVERDVELGALQIEIEYQKSNLTIFWIHLASTKGIIQNEDLVGAFSAIETFIENNSTYAHLTITSYESAVEIRTIPEHNFDLVMWIPERAIDDIMGLNLVTEDEDQSELIPTFNQRVAPILLQLIARKSYDITSPVSDNTCRIIQSIIIMYANEIGLTNESILVFEKRLFRRKAKTQGRYYKAAIESGFVKEDGTRIVPSIPPAHKHLLDLLSDDSVALQEINQRFGSSAKAVTNAAKEFNLVRDSDLQLEKKSLSEFETEVAELIDKLRLVLTSKDIETSEPGKWIDWLLTAYDWMKQGHHEYYSYVILTTIKNLAPSILNDIGTVTDSSATSEPTETEIADDTSSDTIDGKEEEEKEDSDVDEEKTSDGIILTFVMDNAPVTINEIEEAMLKEAMEEDVKRIVFRLILNNKLKLVPGDSEK